MHRQGMHAARPVHAVDVVGGPDHGRLRLPVRGPRLVAVEDAEVGEIGGPVLVPVPRRRHPDHPGIEGARAAGDQRREEMPGEGEVGEVVDGELPLEPVDGDGPGARHDTWAGE